MSHEPTEDEVTAAIVGLAERGVYPDIQEMLLRQGKPLAAALTAANRKPES